jgi:5-formyltetrahydrofolate cyclo-ligase|tara:strand:+ start:99 stop:692 length:594 start_codon:yes stop_codon:yes gene_type:complete
MKSNLRLIAKNNRAKINTINSQNCLTENHINNCLDKVLFNKRDIKYVSLYYPMHNEISPFGFIKYFNLNKFKLTLPVVKAQSRSLLFKEWDLKDKLKRGKLGNLEPFYNASAFLPQLIIVPMLMFDKNLNRLGYGGGYYDKSINELKKHFTREKKDFVTIGLAYSLQETKSIPHEAHDEQLDFIITEKKLLSKINES